MLRLDGGQYGRDFLHPNQIHQQCMCKSLPTDLEKSAEVSAGRHESHARDATLVFGMIASPEAGVAKKNNEEGVRPLRRVRACAAARRRIA
jgi:hypothetical protein